MQKKTIKRKRGFQRCTLCAYAFNADKHKCPSCGTWNMGALNANPDDDQTILLGSAKVEPLVQLQTGPWDPVFGQQTQGKKITVGPINTGVYLLGGVPGAGKSTLALQLATAIIQHTKREIVYVEAEEATGELKARAIRLGITPAHLDKIRVIPMGSSADMATTLRNRKPSGIIVDSLQGLCDTDLDAQVEFCKALKEFTIELKAPGMVISHATKDEGIAGLMALQHAVDMIAFFTVYDDEVREIRGLKSRYGPTLSRMFDMTEKGLILREEDDDEDE